MSSDVLQQARGRVGLVLRKRWKLDGLIGVGGTSAVYAATHRNGSRVAIKVLHSRLFHDPDARRRFLREGYIANTLGSEDVVRAMDDDIEGDIAYLVLELLEGASLEVLRQSAGGRLPTAHVLEIGMRLLRVLEVAHARGVLHRDIKPANLFRTTSPMGFKVLDFGLARAVTANAEHSGGGTGVGVAMGTPAYMPPEQACGLWQDVDPRTDLWSVAATLFTLLTGRFVHEGRTSSEILGAATRERAPALGSVLPEAPETLCALLDRGLGFERGERFQSATQMRLACQRCYEELTTLDRQPSFFAPQTAEESPAVRRRTQGSRDGLERAAPSTIRTRNARPLPACWDSNVGSLWWFYFTGPCTSEIWRSYIELCTRMLQSRQDATVAFFAHHGDIPSATQRRQMARFIEDHHAELGQYLKRFALVVDSSLHRGALTAVGWLVRKPFEERVFTSPLAALSWLSECHPNLDPDAARCSVVSRVPRAALWPELLSNAPHTVRRAAPS